MKEEAQGFPTACGSMGFRLNPKALGVSEKVKFLGKSKLTMGTEVVLFSRAVLIIYWLKNNLRQKSFVVRKVSLVRKVLCASLLSCFVKEQCDFVFCSARVSPLQDERKKHARHTKARKKGTSLPALPMPMRPCITPPFLSLSSRRTSPST